jgi:hypothetical protein
MGSHPVWPFLTVHNKLYIFKLTTKRDPKMGELREKMDTSHHTKYLGHALAALDKP